MTPLDDDVLRRVRQDYPSPIAQAARRFLAAPDEDHLNEGLDLLQTLVLTLGTISLAWCQHRELRPDGVQHWHDRFQRATPTLSDWLGAARAGAKLAGELGVALSGLESALRRPDSRLSADLDTLLRLRTRYAHSAGGREGLAAFDRHLRVILEGCDFLADTKLVLIEANEPQRGGGFRVTVRSVAGDNPILLPAPAFNYPKALFAGTLYLLQEPGDHLEVAPFWVVRKTKDDQAWELFYLNRLIRKGTGFEYLSFNADDSFVDYDLPRSFRWVRRRAAVGRALPAGPES
jgi:hypothetical protein